MSKTNCVNIEMNEENCTCSSTSCEKHGVCCECLLAHLGRDSFPKCVRTKIEDSQELRDYVANLMSPSRS